MIRIRSILVPSKICAFRSHFRMLSFTSSCASIVTNNTFNEQSNLLHPHRKKVQHLIKKLNKKKKRDTTDRTSRQNILFLEIEKALKMNFESSGMNIEIDQVRNPDSIIGAFLFSRSRPTVKLQRVEIIYSTTEGEGLGIIPKSVYASAYLKDAEDIFDKFSVIKVPKTVVGDVVSVQLLMHHNYFVESRLIKVLNPTSKNTRRRDSLIVCEKFHSCSGCHLQMLPYEDQLEFKRNVITSAYKFFYPDLLEEINNESFGAVIGSPMQYAYRSKLTPHFDIPKDLSQKIGIGFNNIDPSGKIIDIDYCPIASQSINQSLPEVKRNSIADLKNSLKEGKKERSRTILLRDSIILNHSTGEHEKRCLSNPKQVVTEKVEEFVFQFKATEFFQNNNSILSRVLEYVRYQLNLNGNKFKYLVDTYCGSGFFGISLSNDIEGKVFGIELSKKAIEYATHNAKLNGFSIPGKIEFIEGTADAIFTNDSFLKSKIRGDETVVIMDPSRKGSNVDFIRQLLEFKPKLIVYVSCNVFTQARDLALLKDLQKKRDCIYKVREIVGFDFFPQTKHVESVAILELVNN